MKVEEHIDALERDGKRLIAVARGSDLEVAVPPCPGWRLRDLVAHIGFVHRWAASYVSNGWTEMMPEDDEHEIVGSAPGVAELVDWAEQAHTNLVSALRNAPADLRCWTFLPASSPLAFWARRQAHETAVHRVDAELAANGVPGASDPAFAADGIDELLFGFVARRRKRDEGPHIPWEGSIVLQASDMGRCWTVRLGGNLAEGLEGDQGGELRVTAGAFDLYLLLWNRRNADGLEVAGQGDLLDKWREAVRVRWS